MKPETVNMTDRKSDSGSDSSWFVQAGDKTIEEVEAKWVTGDGFDDEDTVVEDPAKPMKPETAWSNSGSEANADDVKIVKDHGACFIKGDGLKEFSEETVEINEEEIVKEDFVKGDGLEEASEDTAEIDEEEVAKWVTGDGFDNEDTVVGDPAKPMKPETVWSNLGSEEKC